HLLVITGLTEEDCQRFVLVNDPAAHTDDDVPRGYPLDRCLQTWRNVIYGVHRYRSFTTISDYPRRVPSCCSCCAPCRVRSLDRTWPWRLDAAACEAGLCTPVTTDLSCSDTIDNEFGKQ